jgi:hypothetical protein
MTIEMKVPEFSRMLREQTNTQAELNGTFSQFCSALAEHYANVKVVLPAGDLSSQQVAEVLEKLGNVCMPSGELRRLFDAQVGVLRQAAIPHLVFHRQLEMWLGR